MFKLILSITFSSFLLVQARGEALTPREIMQRYFGAYKTLQFSEVAPYVDAGALAEYRRATSAVIAHARDKFGEDALVTFFQGTPLERLKAASDADYWSFVMASALQFSTERPVMNARPEGEVVLNSNNVLLVYPVQSTLATASELGTFHGRAVYTFNRDSGGWQLETFAPVMFESALYSYLRQMHPNVAVR